MSDIENEKGSIHQVEEVAQQGHVVTDRYGNPLVHIDPVAEAKLRRKLDLHLVPTVAILYLFCFIDRANIGNARLAGLEKDLKLKGYDYNVLLTSFYLAYVLFELPCQWLNKKFGPGRMIPILSFMFGLFSFVMAFVNSFGAAVAVRFLLGIAEGGVFPGIAFYLSRWYRKDELAFRLSLYIVMAPLAGAFGGLLASGILKIDSIGSVHSWKMIFWVEGLVTMGLAIMSWFTLTDNPESAKWLSPEEKALCAARVKSENVGQAVVIDEMHSKSILHGIFNPTTLVVSLIFLLDNITVQGLGFFLPTVIKTIYPKKTTIALQLRTVPPYIVGAFFTLLVPYLSWKHQRRGLYMVLSAPFMMTGYAVFLGTTNSQARYAASFITAIGAFSFGALCTGWGAANSSSDTERAASIGTIVFAGNLGGLIATWVFLPKDAPDYIPANGANLGTSTGILILAAGLWAWQLRENRQKDNGRDDHNLVGKTEAEIAVLGQRHPGFRYRV
ncbi:SPOSA6832_03755 [Sporobolomyces salmonicolor]|uniref:SPOSA6832_03755-mRNA-1:cds n=1 Tax=Sporidiobolus salmonicolor TaxID=5005 RepID=A0A0D6EQY1_SPOSA|nr:SPOSA6832_03755 [Sporobolomyces salmonicolor]